ncbi:MAG: Omp28-related outer membrane protein [Chlorobi bacterium]|nr:Omp28-related outer membrane protein [Chlorobiota bacterium]
MCPTRATFSFLFFFLLVGCRESIPPGLQLTDTQVLSDTTYIVSNPQIEAKRVLIEEFTGVQCSNCPDGHELIDSLKHALGNRIVVVSYHTGIFANPLPESKYDFKTQEGTELQNLLAPSTGYPALIVDRVDFGQDGNLVEDNLSVIPSLVNQQLQNIAIADITLSAEAVSTDSFLITVEVVFAQSITKDVYLSVAIVQDSVIDPQVTPSGTIQDYVHRWIFRDMITSVRGDLLFSSPELGRFIRKTFATSIRNSELPAPESVLYACGWIHLANYDNSQEVYVFNASCTKLK